MDAVTAAFEAVPRAGFLPRRARRRSSYDGPILIGHGQTSSQPRTVEAMLRLLAVSPGHRVLDVGAGSGWTTALVEQLRDGGRIVVPVSGTMTLGLRRGSELETSEHGSYRFVPLL